MLLEKLQTTADIKKLTSKELTLLAAELRHNIISVVSKNGGHLASSLGVVELSIALHFVFNTPRDRIIWDVGHQAYAHKLLTGRFDAFHTIRTCGGLSGFPKIDESEYDSYNVGHSSTSLSLAAGEICARDLIHQDFQVIPVIGDGSMTGGMSFEALNHIGHMKRDVIIVLNDNDHSISPNVGALSEYFTDIITGRFYNRSRRHIYRFLKKLPLVGRAMEKIAENTKKYIKGMIGPGKLFEDLGIRYFGPVDGHNIDHLIEIFRKLKDINNGPKIVHIRTTKGKGYKPAEDSPKNFHGVAAFNIETGKPLKTKGLSYSEVVGNLLTKLAEKDQTIAAITAAMTSGTGLDCFAQTHPERFYDVGIAEQHAVTFAAALARNGLKPFFAVYSTFLQRGYDQLIHDVATMHLPVRLLIDRAGIVGEDGETHHGLFDIAYIRTIPGFTLITPADARQLYAVVAYAAGTISGPWAIRYPRAAVEDDYIDELLADFDPFGYDFQNNGADILLITAGSMRKRALSTAVILKERGIGVSVLNLHSIVPLPVAAIEDKISTHTRYCVIEDHYEGGGVRSAINEKINPQLIGKNSKNFAYPSQFICHGSVKEIEDIYGLSAEKIAAALFQVYNGEN